MSWPENKNWFTDLKILLQNEVMIKQSLTKSNVGSDGLSRSVEVVFDTIEEWMAAKDIFCREGTSPDLSADCAYSSRKNGKERWTENIGVS